jgi:adenylate cyclase
MTGACLTEAFNFRPRGERQDVISRGTQHARRSVALDPTDAIGHAALAFALSQLGRHDEAMAEADLAVNLDPNSVRALGSQGSARTFGGRPGEAIDPLKTAMRLSPRNPLRPFWQHILGRAYYYMGDYQQASAISDQVRQSYPNLGGAWRTLIAALGPTRCSA